MPYYCTVPRCTSMAGKNKNVSFHQFPRDEALAKLWNKILKRGKPYTKYSKVCSLHFTSEDYTITSGQKNKGSWRTLRKNAIPSRNLPTDWPNLQQTQGSSHTPPLPVIDPRMHQQMAQAIYVQTMLAMQAASIISIAKPEPMNSDSNSSSDRSETSSPIDQNEQTLNQESENTETLTQERNLSIISSKVMYKCIQCSKCFKDPDVFILHQRTHTRNLEGNQTNQHTLLSNPILANLLERPESSRTNTGVFNTNNVNSIENQIMMALAANMENYLQNLDSIMTPLSFMDKDAENEVPDNSDSQEADDRSMECQNIIDDAGIDNEESQMEDIRSIESDGSYLVIVEENNYSQITNDSDTENVSDTVKKDDFQKKPYRKYTSNADKIKNANDVTDCDKCQVANNHENEEGNCDEIYKNNSKVSSDEVIDEKENHSMANFMSNNCQENTIIGN